MHTLAICLLSFGVTGLVAGLGLRNYEHGLGRVLLCANAVAIALACLIGV